MPGTVTTRGGRELALRFDAFPTRAHQKIEERIRSLVDTLEQRIEAAAPYKTGKLRSEITPKTYGEQPDRVAGYVSVFAPGAPGEYPKAATLEYGSNKVRRVFQRANILQRLGGSQRRIVARVTKPARIQAFAYLRNPFEAMRPEIVTSLNEAIAEVVAEDNA